MNKKNLLSVFFIGAFIGVSAQIDSLKMNLDFRTRAELDNGQKTLILKDKKTETNVYSRARIGLDYYWGNLEMYAALQDARIWGTTASANQNNGSFNVYEAWAKYNFNKNAALKIGRQILSYDDERLLGALDWQMQARSFDAAKAIFKFGKNSKLETVVTYNNDDIDTNDYVNNEFYSVVDAGERTKSMQILHYEYKLPKSGISFIAVNNVLSPLVKDVHFDMFTAGVNAKYYTDKVGFFGSAYWQTGNNSAYQTKSAYQFSVNADFIVSPKFNVVLGTEWLSGTAWNEDPTKNNSFSPMYGTNHKFNGYMDYFYVGNHFNSFGLNDYYLKSTTKINPKSTLVANLHAFTTNADLGKDPRDGSDASNYLGTELDLVFSYKVAKVFGLQIGHSNMFSARGLELVKKVNDPKSFQSWTWVGFNFNPNFRIK